MDKNNNEEALEKRQTNNENEDIEIKVEKPEEKDDDDDWSLGKPLTNKDTSGRISILFYGHVSLENRYFLNIFAIIINLD